MGRIATVSSASARNRKLLVAALAAPALVALGTPAFAATKYWDINGATGGAGGATPAGSWSSAFWTTNSAGTTTTTNFTSGTDAAVFSAGSDATGEFAVSLTSAVTAASVLVEEGTVDLTGAALTTQAITINSGATLSYVSSGAIVASSGASMTLNGGTFRDTNSGSGGTFLNTNMGIVLGTGGGTLSYTTSNSLAIYAGVISGAAGNALIKDGAGVLALSGANTYSGGTIINGGELRIRSSANRLPTAGAVTVNGTGILNLNDQDQQIGSLTGNGTVGLGSKTLTVSGTSSTTFSGVIKDVANAGAGAVTTGAGNLTKSGASTLTLTGANTYTGNTSVTTSGGGLQIGDGGTSGSIVSNVSVGNGALLTFNRSDASSYNGVVSGSGAVTKTGAGTLTINNNDWTNGGATTISQGTLKLGNANAGLSNSSTVTISAGATLDMNAFTDTIGALAGAGSIVNGGNLTVAGAGSTFSGSMNLAGTFTKSSTSTGTTALSGNNTVGKFQVNNGIVTLTGANVVTTNVVSIVGNGTLAASSGRINFNNDNAAGSADIFVTGVGAEISNSASGITTANTIHLDGSAANPVQIESTSGNSWNITGKVTGIGSLLRDNDGAGMLTLSGNNDFSGGLQITSRNLVLAHKSALGAGTFTIGDAVAVPATAIVLSSAANLTGANAMANAVTVNQDFTIDGSSGFELSGNMTLNGAARTITVTNTGASGTSLSGAISGTASLKKAGSSSLVLTKANTYSGGTEVAVGTLVANNGNSGKATGSGLVKVDALSVLTTTTGGTVGSVNVLAGGTISAAPGVVLTVDGDASVAGSASGNVVVNGDLAVTGAIAPGNSPGVISAAGDISLGGTTNMEIGGTLPNQYDRINAGGAMTFGGTLNVTFISSFVPTIGDSFHLFDFSTSSGQFALINLPTLGDGQGVWDLHSLYATGTISVVPLPTAAWMGLGLLGTLGVARRRRKVQVV